MNPLSTRDTTPGASEADEIRGLARQHLVDQLRLSAAAGDAAQRELNRLLGWVEARSGVSGVHVIDRAAGHTARLLGAMARVQNAQANGALALARLDGRGMVQRIVVARETQGEGGGGK
jgi:hypothetical protein